MPGSRLDADHPENGVLIPCRNTARSRAIHQNRRRAEKTALTFEPQHFILKRAVPFFVDRFSNMDWLIATPSGTAAFEDGQLQFGPPPEHKPNFSDDGVLDELWLTYYRTTFNPARLRTKAMVNEMRRHYWANLPEAALIPEIITGAAKRVERMAALLADRPQLFAKRIAAEPRNEVTAPTILLDKLRAEAAFCTRCPLHGPATQTIFCEGASNAKIMFVGEQPGDQEDLIGQPFVGPAGELFDRALLEAGLDRRTLYVTNAVKHFKYEPRGKRRIHQKPNAGEVTACRWWLEREISTPRLIVALGSTAANALAGRQVSVSRERGPMAFGFWNGFVTTHPSYLLRIPGVSKAKMSTRYLFRISDEWRGKSMISKRAASSPRGTSLASACSLSDSYRNTTCPRRRNSKPSFGNA